MFPTEGDDAPPGIPAGYVTQAMIADAAVSLAKQANLAESTMIGRAAAAGAGVPQALTPAQIFTLLSIAASSYTPALTHTTNVFASTSSACPYIRVGNFVIVAGVIAIDPTTASTTTVLDISLPIASALTGSEQVAGVGASSGAATQMTGAVTANAGNDRAKLTFLCGTDANNNIWTFIFMYQII